LISKKRIITNEPPRLIDDDMTRKTTQIGGETPAIHFCEYHKKKESRKAARLHPTFIQCSVETCSNYSLYDAPKKEKEEREQPLVVSIV
jgi:hypothetical protein